MLALDGPGVVLEVRGEPLADVVFVGSYGFNLDERPVQVNEFGRGSWVERRGVDMVRRSGCCECSESDGEGD